MEREIDLSGGSDEFAPPLPSSPDIEQGSLPGDVSDPATDVPGSPEEAVEEVPPTPEPEPEPEPTPEPVPEPEATPEPEPTPPAPGGKTAAPPRKYLIFEEAIIDGEKKDEEITVYRPLTFSTGADCIEARNGTNAIRAAARLLGEGYKGNLVAIPLSMWKPRTVAVQAQASTQVSIG